MNKIKINRNLSVSMFEQVSKKLEKLGITYDCIGNADGTIDITVNGVIIIDAKRWFQKTYGNTYHSVIVSFNGIELGKVDFTYGYGEHYKQTAFEILSKNGFFDYEIDGTLVPNLTVFGQISDSQHFKTYDNKDKAYHDYLMEQRENDYKNFHITCIDVTRKKDL